MNQADSGAGGGVGTAGLPGNIGEALQCGMFIEGVDVFHGGGLLSVVHTEADIDRSIEAFDTTIRRMIGEGVFN